MSTAAAKTTDAPPEDATPSEKKAGKGKLIMLAAPIPLVALLAGLWFTGILPRVLGLSHEEAHKQGAVKPAPPPSYVDLPELVANLNSNPRRPNYIKIVARLEVPRAEDVERVRAVLPHLQD
jgi:flagellar FliL protein